MKTRSVIRLVILLAMIRGSGWAQDSGYMPDVSEVQGGVAPLVMVCIALMGLSVLTLIPLAVTGFVQMKRGRSGLPLAAKLLPCGALIALAAGLQAFSVSGTACFTYLGDERFLPLLYADLSDSLGFVSYGLHIGFFYTLAFGILCVRRARQRQERVR